MTDPLALHGERMSMVWERSDEGVPRWRHWGTRLDAAPPCRLDEMRGAASFSLDRDRPLDLAPAGGGGWFGPAALVAHRDGRHIAHRWQVQAIDQHDGQIRVTLVDRGAAIELVQRLSIDPATDVATISASVINRGSDLLSVEWLASAIVPLPVSAASIRSFAGRHNAELVETLEAMPAHGWRREQRRGITGHGGPPGLFILGAGSGWHDGPVHAAQLAWSGNHVVAVERDEDGGWMLSLGERLEPGEISLAPGEGHHSPDALVTYSGEGLNRASHNFHAAIRARMQWPSGEMRPRPVHLNSWEGFYFDHDELRAMALASDAAALGIERFVLDDGWFAGRADDRAGLGDWTPDPIKYPAGLKPLADHVIGLGMEFGLWVEPEMINPDSDLYRAHPEWVLGAAAGVGLPAARHQLVLDLGQDEVRDHLFGVLDGLLSTVPIAYLKWDHNRHLAPIVGADGRASAHRQVAGLYQLIDRVRAAHPVVEIESCAGGGGRIDAGIAGRVHRFWASDNLDALSRVSIQRGFLAFLPPELMGAHVGASPAHATGRSQSFDFRAAVALAGHFGLELEPSRLEPAERSALVAAIERYKQLRGRLHHGRTWLGEGHDGLVWQAVGEPGNFLLFVIRTDPPRDTRPQPIPLPFCHGAGALQLRSIALSAARQGPPVAAWFERLRAAPQAVDGDWLAAVGMPIPAMAAETVALFAVGPE